MSIDFTQPRPDNRRFLKQVTGWVEDMLPDALDSATVMVNEMQCFEPVRAPSHLSRDVNLICAHASVRWQGCAPLETVVTLLAQQSIVFKIFKPVAEVQPQDVSMALQNALAGQTMQHMNAGPQ